MGKIERVKHKRPFKHNPLDEEILSHRYAKASSRNKNRRKESKDESFVSGNLTTGILKLAQEQQKKLEKETGVSHSKTVSPQLGSSFNEQAEELTSVDLLQIENEIQRECANISEEDERALKKFMTPRLQESQDKNEVEDIDGRVTIEDVIKEKLTEKKTELCTVYSDIYSEYPGDEEQLKQFAKLAPFLREYRSGRLPKAFKAIPRFTNWEVILHATNPDCWSAATMYQATRMFSSNLQDKMAQRFYNLFLLPRLRDDIAECKVLNPYLYQALKKALYKPAAFFKGMIIPLVKSGDCTLREATIFGSVLAKCSVPVLHSSAALLTIAEMGYTGVSSIFMRVLLEKKYALPNRVVNAVANHFLQFMNDSSQFPVLWHQCLLTFVQLYKSDLSLEQKSDLMKLIKIHSHEKVTPEIRKHLGDATDEISEQLWKL